MVPLSKGEDTGSQSNTLCSGFVPKMSFQDNFGIFFHWYLCRNRYIVCVEFENVMKSTQKKKYSSKIINLILGVSGAVVCFVDGHCTVGPIGDEVFARYFKKHNFL